jgi:hypothetical protein
MLAGVAVACVACGGTESRAGGLPCDKGAEVKLSPPQRGITLGAYPPLDDVGRRYAADAAQLRAFRRIAGRQPAWATFADVWLEPSEIAFPMKRVKQIWAHGSVPRIYLWPVSAGFVSGAPDPLFSMEAFIAGRFDAALSRWARGARRSGVPLMVEFGPEANNDGFPWGARHNGGGRKVGYGDPSVPDGAERFSDAYGHVVEVMRRAGARNITWSFHVVPDYGPSWNKGALYYPGDRYVDWIGLSVYGLTEGKRPAASFRSLVDREYPRLAAISRAKPLAVMEFAVEESGRPEEKGHWITSAFRDLRAERWPRIKAAVWWNELVDWEELLGEAGKGMEPSDFRINSSRAARSAYRRAASDPFFRSRPSFACGPMSRRQAAGASPTQ